MKELKGALVFAGGLVLGYYAGLVCGAAIQKTADKKDATQLKLV